MANSYNMNYGIIIARAWCILVCCSRLYMRVQSADDIYQRGSSVLTYKYGDSSQSNVAQTVNGDGSGDNYIIYGDCRASRITTRISNSGSGDTYLLYGYTCTSNNCRPLNSRRKEEWPRNIYNQGSGDLYVRFGNCSSSSSSTLDLSVYNRGSGKVRIYYEYYSSSKVSHTMSNVGSGRIYVQNANQASQVQKRSANKNEQMAHDMKKDDIRRRMNDLDSQYNRESARNAIEAGPRGQKMRDEEEKRRPRRQ